jgi:hypothetical protein
MFSFLKPIYRFFKQKKEKTKENPNHLCSLKIEVNHDSSLNIICYWPDLTNLDENVIDNVANPYAALLYLLNGGLLNQDIIKALSNFQENNIEDAYFVNKVLSKWLELATPKMESKNNNIDPMIRPSSVFKNYTK